MARSFEDLPRGPTSHEVINRLIDEVQNATGERWNVVEYTVPYRHRIFFKKKIKLYRLFSYDAFGWSEVRFYRDPPHHPYFPKPYPAELIVGFLHGVLDGVDAAQLKHHREEQDGKEAVS